MDLMVSISVNWEASFPSRSHFIDFTVIYFGEHKHVVKREVFTIRMSSLHDINAKWKLTGKKRHIHAKQKNIQVFYFDFFTEEHSS